MPSRNQDYSLIAVLHDQLEAIETYDKYLKAATDCENCAQIWTLLKSQAEAAVASLAELHRADSAADFEDVVEVVIGPVAVAQRFHQVQLGAVEEVCALVTGTPAVVSGSDNVAAVEVEYPAPERLDDGASVSLIYRDDVVLPLSVTPAAPDRPITLRVEARFGVCSMVCIPTGAGASVTLTPASPRDRQSAPAVPMYRRAR